MPSCVCQYWQRHTGTWQNLFLGLPLNSTELRRKGLRFRWGGLRFRSGGLRSSVFGPLALPRPRWQQRRIIQRSRSKNTPALQANRHETWWYVRYIRIHSFIHSLKSKKKEKKENPKKKKVSVNRAVMFSLSNFLVSEVMHLRYTCRRSSKAFLFHQLRDTQNAKP